tara:strand:+ start:5561 stop:6829 length:1269 start_codon:yes stop_codon:yes gene_type:complete
MKTILVRGPALSRSGYGEQTRFALRALRTHEDRFNILVQNISWGQTGWITDDTEERRWIDNIIGKTHHHLNQQLPIDISLQVTIPNEWEKIAPINIGYTAGIEASKIAPVWIEKSFLMDRIITISNHSKKVFESTVYEALNEQTQEKFLFKTETPIHVVHYPVKDLTVEKLDIELDYDFNFLTVAQMGPRKNLANTIKWFIEEFKDEEVGLVVKTNIANCSTFDQHRTANDISRLINQVPERKCKVYLLHGDLTLQQMNSLYTNPKIKCYVTHTHGEGFGIPIFEAAYFGVPVIAPQWSGQNDFLHAPIKVGKQKKAKLRPLFCRTEYTISQIPQEAVWDGVLQADAMWCIPSEKGAKNSYREMYKNYKKYAAMAKKLKKYILQNFTEQEQHEEFVNFVLGEEELELENWLSEFSEELQVHE